MLVIEELHDGACRWPVAEFDRGEFLFCGEQVADGCPYYQVHWLLAYKPRRAVKSPVARLEARESVRQELIAIAAAAC
jgi:hypothetical protein